MTRLAESILQQFAEAFPESAHYRGGRKLRLGKWPDRFPGITRDVEKKEAFLEAVDELLALELVSVKWVKFREHTEVEAIYLEDPERMYEALGRRSPESIRAEMIATLDSPEWRGACLASHGHRSEYAGAIRDRLRAELETRHPVAFEDASEVLDLARLLSAPESPAATLPVRALSVKLYNDSKRLERLLPAADRVCRQATGIPLSDALALGRSYPEVTLACFGAISFDVPESRTWELRGEPMTLPAQTVSAVSAVEIQFGDSHPRILSVENKETFYAFSERLRRLVRRPSGGHDDACDALASGTGTEPLRCPWAGIVYSAGHPNRAVVELLRKVGASGAEIHHFGDLDPDGLLILTELSEATGTAVHPAYMNCGVYQRYLEFGYRLSSAAVARVESALNRIPPSLGELAREIIDRRIGIEQEIIDPDGCAVDFTHPGTLGSTTPARRSSW